MVPRGGQKCPLHSTPTPGVCVSVFSMIVRESVDAALHAHTPRGATVVKANGSYIQIMTTDKQHVIVVADERVTLPSSVTSTVLSLGSRVPVNQEAALWD